MMMTRRRHHDVSSSLRWKSWHLWVFFCFFFWCLPLMKTSFCCFKRAYSKRLNDLIPEMKTKTEKSEVRTRRHLFSIQISNRPPSAGMVPVYLSSSKTRKPIHQRSGWGLPIAALPEWFWFRSIYLSFPSSNWPENRLSNICVGLPRYWPDGNPGDHDDRGRVVHANLCPFFESYNFLRSHPNVGFARNVCPSEKSKLCDIWWKFVNHGRSVSGQRIWPQRPEEGGDSDFRIYLHVSVCAWFIWNITFSGHSKMWEGDIGETGTGTLREHQRF